MPFSDSSLEFLTSAFFLSLCFNFSHCFFSSLSLSGPVVNFAGLKMKCREPKYTWTKVQNSKPISQAWAPSEYKTLGNVYDDLIHDYLISERLGSMPCRSVLMQISCLIRGICDYEEIARRCFYLIRKWKVIVFTPWLGGTDAEKMGSRMSSSWGRTLKWQKDRGVWNLPTLFIHLLKHERKGLNSASCSD